MNNDKLVITGMSIITPIGDTLDGYYDNLLRGQSAITRWKSFETDKIYAKVGADLFGYDAEKKLKEMKELIPEEIFLKAKHLMSHAPFSESITIIAALKLWLDGKIEDWSYDPHTVSVVVAGHNLNRNYEYENHEQFNEEPDFIEGLYALRGLDTDHAGIVTETLGLKGSTYTVGAACASGNAALKLAIDEILHHEMNASVVIAPVFDFSPMEFQGLCLMDAISYMSFNDDPEKASRPYDTHREGFVPAHGAAALLVERIDAAKERGAHIYAEVIGVESSADGNHLPQPSSEDQALLMNKLLDKYGIKPTDIDYINAHATSTPLGDLSEVRAIKNVFGEHAYKLKVNAPKSMLGHTCWSSATVETVGAILQMNHNKLHPSINIDDLDPEVDLDVCREGSVEHEIHYLMKNSFGFGGLNCVAIFKQYE